MRPTSPILALTTALAALPLVGGLVPAAVEAPTSAAQAAAVPTLTWEDDCYSGGVQCARAQVPLDYDDPTGQHVSLRLARLPATDSAHRIGTLFVNPGGPGNSGVDFVLLAAREVLSAKVRARFDVVGFDPRGVARSAPVQCWAPLHRPDLFDGLPAFPLTRRQEDRTLIADGAYTSACIRREPVITRHMSTANVARDLDLLRQAVGDDQLTYAGFSYGTYLGATYANLFPDRVRAIWVDGVLDPVAWATGRGDGQRVPFSTRLRSGESSTATMRAFLRACDRAGDRCVFASAHTQAKFDRLLARLRAEPVRDEDGEVQFRYGDAVAGMLPPLYFQDAWPNLADQLQFLARLTRPGRPQRQAATSDLLHRVVGDRRLGGEPNPGNDVDAFNAVACVDTRNPRDPQAWPRAADAADRAANPFGRLWTWESDACATWGAQDADVYRGPFTARTSAPVLVVGNRLDPATPYRGARALDRLLPRSRLLTVDYAGHTSLGQSRCVTRAVTRYLLDQALPPEGAVCAADRAPFEPVPAAERRVTTALQRILLG